MSDLPTNPFSSFAYHKNPFDPLDMSDVQNALGFSGFGEFQHFLKNFLSTLVDADE